MHVSVISPSRHQFYFNLALKLKLNPKLNVFAAEYEIGIPIAGSPCSYTITPSMSINKTGALISPTYPGAYPKDMSCTYQFLGESNQRVRLEFRDFDLFFGGPQ